MSSGKLKTPALVKNLAELMDILEFTKEQLASKLGLSRVAIVHWEKGRSKPSSENYIRLATLASKHAFADKEKVPACAFWFWEQAGVDSAALRAFVPGVEESLKRYRNSKSSHAPGSETVAVPLVNGSFFDGDLDSVRARLNPLDIQGAMESFVTLPRAVAPNPDATLAVRAVDKYMSPIFFDGDIVCIEYPCPDFLLRTMDRRSYQPIVAACHERRDPSSAQKFREGLNLAWMLRSGSDLGIPTITLETEFGRNLARRRAFTYQMEDVDPTENMQSERRTLTGYRQWEIVGIVVGWLGTDRGPHSKNDEVKK